MLAGGAELGSLLGLDDETAVAALPPDLAVALEEITVREAAQQLQVAALVARASTVEIILKAVAISMKPSSSATLANSR